jgi:NAD(P)-dependent dehydrogenase (short-subunit alcohol dehydrogenase family)
MSVDDSIDLSGRVAIVTGAGGGIGREHALLLGRLGAKVVVNDIGDRQSQGSNTGSAAQQVADEIVAAGGEAIANLGSVTDFKEVEAMVASAMARWQRVDILINNAGILRDKTFRKMALEEFRLVLEVHLMGAVHCTKAVWEIMRSQRYGRIVMTTSSSGLYGNFGQSNYGAAKMALVGLMQTLALEGGKYNIRVNCIAPTAATRMMEGLMSTEAQAAFTPRAVAPAIAALVCTDAPTRMVLCAGAGSFAAAHVTLTRGRYLGVNEATPQEVLRRLGEIADRTDEIVPGDGRAQADLEIGIAREGRRSSGLEHESA